MSFIVSGLALLLALLLLATGVAIYFWQEAKGGLRLWRSMDARKKSFSQRKDEKNSPQEILALEVVLETCSRYQKEQRVCEEGFLPETLHLISQIARIYYPDAKAPMDKARIGNLLSAFLAMNHQVLDMLEIPGLEKLTQFRLREVLPDYAGNKKGVGFVPKFLKHRLRLLIVRALWVQWNLFVGEAAIKVYGEHRADEVPEPETLLSELDALQDETNLLLPEDIREIVKTSRKNILYAVKPLSVAEVKAIYISLTQNIARAWHPQSSRPLYEVRVYDLLKSLADYLEWAGSLSKKPVLNKMLGLRLSYLISVKEVALPFANNKIFDWVKKYQMGRAAKWSKTMFSLAVISSETPVITRQTLHDRTH